MISPYIYAGLSGKDQYLSRHGIKVTDKHEILDAVCYALEVDKEALKSLDRHRDTVNARHIAMGLIRKHNPETSLMNIGKMFNRDHSTVIYAVRNFDNLYGVDKIFTAQVDHVMKFTNHIKE